MQTKKILGVALCAALITSMAAIATTSVAAADFVASEHTFGVIGAFASSNWGTDVAMTDADGDGVYEATVTDAGSYEFKVRADGAWDWSWGTYEEEYDRTQNSQTNCSVTVAEGQKLIVKLDTTKVDDAAKANADSAVNADDFDFAEEGFTYWPVTFEVVDAADAEQYKPFETLGVIGAFASSGWTTDVAMTDADGDGIYEATVTDAGSYEFKVRADGSWDYSWGVYEDEYDRTQNSQTNCSVTVAEGQKLVVKLDTTKVDDAAKANADSAVNADDFDFAEEGYNYWPVTFEVVKAEEESSEEESSQEESSEEESSKEEESSQEEQKVTVLTDYVYFDNSETKWEEVYAYWWESSYGRTYDLEDNDFGWIVELDEDGNPKTSVNAETGETVVNHVPLTFPGTKMTQIPGTDVWQVRIPFGAQKIIFNSGKSDYQVKVLKEKGYQTADLSFDATANAGQIYVVDAVPTTENPDDRKANPKPGMGVEKTKYRYERGEWKDYTGEFVPEVLKSEESKDESSSTEESSKPTSVVTPDTSKVNPDGGDNVKTGDATMPVAVAAVAVAALGVVVFAAKKKSDEE